LTAATIVVMMRAMPVAPATPARRGLDVSTVGNTSANTIACVRAFNRFYTRQLGLLDEHLLASEFSLAEVRVLYELAQREGLSAATLVRELGINAGYMSRIVAKLQARGLLKRSPSATDARQTLLSLSAKGHKAFAPLDAASRAQVQQLLAPLKPTQTQELVRAMQRIEALLGHAPAPTEPYLLRPHQVGDIGWVAHRQGLLYAQEYGWDASFEALVAQIAAKFVQKFDPAWEHCWIAEREGQVVGSVFLVRRSATVAQLRLLYVEPAARGLGIGARLTQECIRFATDKGYRRLMLWTNAGLDAARHLYEAAGFVLKEEERHHSFGKPQVGQIWELALATRRAKPNTTR
jgi:DNA-binding MarR family transcriptional regulator/GNAT superfamily N-acetyltransferase